MKKSESSEDYMKSILILHVLAELEKEPFTDLLDCGCGPAPMITLLHEKYPEKHYTGIG